MPPRSKERSLVATYESHTAAASAIMSLHKAGIDMQRFSLVGRGFHTEEQPLGFYSAGDRIRHWGGRGAFLGSVWGVLFGTAFFFFPTTGPLVILGPLVAQVVGALEGAVLGGSLGAFSAAFAQLGIPRTKIMKYEADLKTGKFLVLARGATEFLKGARSVLRTTGASHLATC